MEWITEPTIWFGLLTLIALEIVLGIDNLIFIAILAGKLPPKHRDRARIVGLSLALVTRLGLLASISWVMSLTAPLFTLLTLDISWRDIILIVGGVFLLIKATIEIHDRLEAVPHGHAEGGAAHASFWPVIAQIVVLDIVFSLDSVITAVGMVDELYVMMAAVVVAVLVMLVASKPLTQFMHAHPSLVILCLGFLLMIGLVLVADGLGVHIPKGYVYVAIGFSILIETFNQVGLRNRRKRDASLPRRQHVADTVFRLLGGVPVAAPAVESGNESAPPEEDSAAEQIFTPVEKRMVHDVLALADRPVQTIMTPRRKVVWIDADDSREDILATMRESPHRQFIVSRDSIEDVAGIARKEDILELYLGDKPFDLMAALQQPTTVYEGASILDALNLFKGTPVEMALVVDEYGGLQGIVTQTDLLEAIAGDFPEARQDELELTELEDGSFQIDGEMTIQDVQEQLALGALPEGDFNSIAGFVLFLFGRVPARGERFDWDGWSFEVSRMDGWRIDKLLARRTIAAGAADAS